MIDIGGGRLLHAVRAGPEQAGGPLVVLEAGAFGFSTDWTAEGMASLAYDRAGLGFSDPGPAPRDGLAIAADLEALLGAIGEHGPLILCGHSMAGLHVRLFAARNSGRVVGVVLVDATTPEAMDSRLVSGFVGQFAGAARLTAWGAEVGLLAPFANTGLGDMIGLDGAAHGEKVWAFALGRHNHWAAEEVTRWPDAARQARQAGAYDPSWPVAVILAGPPKSRAAMKKWQSAPALGSRHGVVEHLAGASHATMLGGAYADAIVRGIDHVRTAAILIAEA
jgi:pimeloyl-ACP methyl ester carboxylesterase